MAIVGYNPCDNLGNHTPAGDCITEGTGIPGLLLIKKGFDLTTVIDGTSYAAAKTANNLKVVKDLEAYWPGATPQTIPGKAGRMERLGHIQYELPFTHEGVDANMTFWNIMNHARNWGVALITEDYKAYGALDRQLEPILCSFFAVPGGDQEFGKILEMRGTVKWKSRDLPVILDPLIWTQNLLKADFQS